MHVRMNNAYYSLNINPHLYYLKRNIELIMYIEYFEEFKI